MEDNISSEQPDDGSDQPASPPRKPRVWTVFVAVVLALIAAIGWQAVVAIPLMARHLTPGVNPETLQRRVIEELTTPTMFMLSVVGGQIAFGLAALIPAGLSSESLPKRLGLSRPHPSWHVYPLATLGSLLPLTIGFALAHALALILPADETVQMLYDNMTLAISVPFVLFIAVMPGICEELFFRGYLQRRLLQRWSPGWAIVITSILFALMHITPHGIVATLPLGLWFGVVAWRSGSIVPGMVCHAFVNGAVNAWRVLVKFADVPETFQFVFLAASLAFGAACFVALLRTFRTAERIASQQGGVAADRSES